MPSCRRAMPLSRPRRSRARFVRCRRKPWLYRETSSDYRPKKCCAEWIRRSIFSADGCACPRWSMRSTISLRAGTGEPRDPGLPEHDGAEYRQRQDRKAEIEPRLIAAGVLGRNEQMNDEPQADGKPEQHADEVARRLVNRPNVLDLRPCNTRGDNDQYDDEGGAKRQPRQPHPLRRYWHPLLFVRRYHG